MLFLFPALKEKPIKCADRETQLAGGRLKVPPAHFHTYVNEDDAAKNNCSNDKFASRRDKFPSTAPCFRNSGGRSLLSEVIPANLALCSQPPAKTDALLDKDDPL